MQQLNNCSASPPQSQSAVSYFPPLCIRNTTQSPRVLRVCLFKCPPLYWPTQGAHAWCWIFPGGGDFHAMQGLWGWGWWSPPSWSTQQSSRDSGLWCAAALGPGASMGDSPWEYMTHPPHGDRRMVTGLPQWDDSELVMKSSWNISEPYSWTAHKQLINSS